MVRLPPRSTFEHEVPFSDDLWQRGVREVSNRGLPYCTSGEEARKTRLAAASPSTAT